MAAAMIASAVRTTRPISVRIEWTARALFDGDSTTISFAENTYLKSWCINSDVTDMTERHSAILWSPTGSLGPMVEDVSVTDGEQYARPASRHSGGFNIAFWGGETRFVADTIDYTVYGRLMSSDGRRTQDPAVDVYPGTADPAWQTTPLSGTDY